MDEQTFMEQMIDLLDTEKVITMDTLLIELDEWDSLSFVSFLALATSISAQEISPKKVRDATTINDLYLLLNKGV